MCQNSKFIVNKYDGRKYFVSCGHCEACRQEKANAHVKRILHEQMSSPSIGVFITLHYENQYVPYILKSEVEDFLKNPLDNYVNVYRDGELLDTYSFLDFCDDDGNVNTDLSTDFKFIRKKLRNGRFKVLDDKVSVVRIRDIQLFFKRLKINLFRDGYTGYFSYYYASEYGEQYNRAHFHVLAFVDKEYYERFKLLVDKSWNYADLLKYRKGNNGVRQSIEVAKNPAKYVASYLNCDIYVPSFLQKSKPFKPFTHFSNGFGCNMSEFTLSSIMEKINRGTLRYNYTKVVGGVSTICSARIPKYVLSRYFPKFKGYRYLSSNALIKCICRPSAVYEIPEFYERFRQDDLDKIFKVLIGLGRKLSKVLGIGKSWSRFNVALIDWSLAYSRVWSIYASESIRDSYDAVKSSCDMWYHYDNIKDYFSGDVMCDFLDDIPLSSHVVSDPNEFPFRVAKTQFLTKAFVESVKHHVIKNSFYEKSFAI